MMILILMIILLKIGLIYDLLCFPVLTCKDRFSFYSPDLCIEQNKRTVLSKREDSPGYFVSTKLRKYFN